MSGFLSLWAIVEKEEIAAINAAALLLTRFCGKRRLAEVNDDRDRQASGSILDFTPRLEEDGQRARHSCSHTKEHALCGANQPDITGITQPQPSQQL